MENGAYARTSTTTSQTSEEDADVRSGPWTAEEDFLLVNYINMHGEGRWNSLARSAGLKRTGKSCRLRWLNYLRPNVRRGNITLEEQLLILELHFHLGNRWSKIAQHLPGRTDNEIKNYWRTRVQKHAKQLKCDVNSKKFKDVMRYVWMPRLQERIRAANSGTAAARQDPARQADGEQATITGSESGPVNPISESASCGPVSSFDRSSVGTHVSSPVTVTTGEDIAGEWIQGGEFCEYWSGPLASPCGYSELVLPDIDWWQGGEFSANLWNVEDNWII